MTLYRQVTPQVWAYVADGESPRVAAGETIDAFDYRTIIGFFTRS
jgi:hypothetical protein